MEQITELFQQNHEVLLGYLLQLIAAIVIFYVGRIIARSVSGLLEKGLLSRKIDRKSVV